MTATPAIFARYTRDGVALTYTNPDLKAAHPTAVDAGEIPTFFRYRADAAAVQNERASLLTNVGRIHEAIEVDEVLGIGTSVPVFPVVPTGRVIDDTRDLDVRARVRSVSFDMTIDRYSLEFLG